MAQLCRRLHKRYLVHEKPEVLGLGVEVEVELDVGGADGGGGVERGQVGARHQDRAARRQADREGVEAVAPCKQKETWSRTPDSNLLFHQLTDKSYWRKLPNRDVREILKKGFHLFLVHFGKNLEKNRFFAQGCEKASHVPARSLSSLATVGCRIQARQ